MIPTYNYEAKTYCETDWNERKVAGQLQDNGESNMGYKLDVVS